MEYFIAINGQQQGPFTIDALRGQHITPDTLVWAQGMSNWMPASQVGELQPLFFNQSAGQPQYQHAANVGGAPYQQAGPQQPATDVIAKPIEDVTNSLDDGRIYRKWMPTVYLILGFVACILPVLYIIQIASQERISGMMIVVAIVNIIVFLAAGVIGLFYWLNRRKSVKTLIDTPETSTLQIVGHFLQSIGECVGLLYYGSMSVAAIITGVFGGIAGKRRFGDIITNSLGGAVEYIIYGLIVLALGRFFGEIAKKMKKED
ncbi:MAG: DUF4339 domain-containing protein [Prevotella sp.]|nr:DUF4339 domain-containing protein [Prevotella sp.]